MLHTGHPLPHRLTWSAILVEWDPRILGCREDKDLSGPGDQDPVERIRTSQGLGIRTSLRA